MSQNTTNTANVYIDLATFSELEGFMYGGPEAITHFVSAVQKSNWFSFIPIALRTNSNDVKFGSQNVTTVLNRSPDYILSVWARMRLPQLMLVSPVAGVAGPGTLRTDAGIRWSENVGHNIFHLVTLHANELPTMEYRSEYLDVHAHYRVSESRKTAYKNMIGATSRLTTFATYGNGVHAGGLAANRLGSTGGDIINVPLPTWFSEDSGVALPVAMAPLNEFRLTFNLRRWQDLVIVFPGSAAGGTVDADYIHVKDASTLATPELSDFVVHAHAVVVHQDERIKMGDAPRDMLIRQVQSTHSSVTHRLVNSVQKYDVYWSHSVISMYFMYKNITRPGDLSNYTTTFGKPVPSGLAGSAVGFDPIGASSLNYESQKRFDHASDYTSLVHPFFFNGEVGPTLTGYHQYSYALQPWNHNTATGSTNYSKIANASFQHSASLALQNATDPAAPTGEDVLGNAQPLVWPVGGNPNVIAPQKFEAHHIAVNWNIVRFANSSISFPTF